MITPQWDEDFFGDHKNDFKTTIILDDIVDESTNFSAALASDVAAIGPELTLFLRRLERLEVVLGKEAGKSTISKRFQRLNWTSEPGVVSIKDMDENALRHYYKHPYTVTFNGNESKRPEITKTEVMLAFPVKKTPDGALVPLTDKKTLAYAYLPLGDFGFKFVINADMLTTSNRQSVDEDSPWNLNIAKAIPLVFKAAVNEFNKGNREMAELAKTWPLYLQHDTNGLSNYWSGIKDDLVFGLMEARVVRDRTGKIREPNKLMFLDWACDRKGKPMFGAASDYLSADYPDSVRKALLLLNVKEPTWEWLCEQLQTLHQKGLLQTRMQNKEWCSDLAKVILKPQASGYTTKSADLKSIPLLPLADGTWSCPPTDKNPIFFPVSLGTAVPPGLSLALVDEGACACADRKGLFRLLGVKDCDISSIVRQIFDYQVRPQQANADHLIAQLRYLYQMRANLTHEHDIKKMRFVDSERNVLPGDSNVYVDTSPDQHLRKLFSGYNAASLLHDDYFANLKTAEQADFTQWLRAKANVTTAPRFISSPGFATQLHRDFEWLLQNKRDHILAVLHQHRDLFFNTASWNIPKDAFRPYDFKCMSGGRAPLHETYVPLPELMESAQQYANARECHFLDLPGDDPKNWIFLSKLNVGVMNGLDFHLWILQQPGFTKHLDISKSKALYLAIQSLASSGSEFKRVVDAFDKASIAFPSQKAHPLKGCVWRAPKTYSSKPSLARVYGSDLSRLSHTILQVKNATLAEAQECLEKMREKGTTTMAHVAGLYVFLHNHYANTFKIDIETPIIAVPSQVRVGLEWKMPSECVWDDQEFCGNGLELRSKVALRPIIEQHAPAAQAFLTETVKLGAAGVDELIGDLIVMSNLNRDDTARVNRLYERIDSYRRREEEKIKHAFQTQFLVFLKTPEKDKIEWLMLADCIWEQSILQNKYALAPTLNDHRGLFQETLQVPNVTLQMLIDELLVVTTNPADDDCHEYAKTLLSGIARKTELGCQKDLNGQYCWPCRTPKGLCEFRSIKHFLINDRQDLYDIFSNSFVFLDFDFGSSRELSALLLEQGGRNISAEVVSKTEAHEPLKPDKSLTQDFRSRAHAIMKYFEHVKCTCPYELLPLLQTLNVSQSARIETHHTLGKRKKTKLEGGSSVKVTTKEDKTTQLDIYVSTDKGMRDCALHTDFTTQLISALELNPSTLPDLQAILLVPRHTLPALLIRQGIIGAGDRDEYLPQADDNGESEEEAPKTTQDGDRTTISAASNLSDRSRDSTGTTVDMSSLSKTLAPVSTSNGVNSSQTVLLQSSLRSEDQVLHDGEIGREGERWVYTLLKDVLRLPGFTTEMNWTSNSREKYGHAPFVEREVSGFTYKDTKGELTRHFREPRQPYKTPAWLSTICDNGNQPLYHIEVKTSTNWDPKIDFHLSQYQYSLAKRWRVVSKTPKEAYVIVRIWGLSLNPESKMPPYRVYLDPYTLDREGVLDVVADEYSVTATV